MPKGKRDSQPASTRALKDPIPSRLGLKTGKKKKKEEQIVKWVTLNRCRIVGILIRIKCRRKSAELDQRKGNGVIGLVQGNMFEGFGSVRNRERGRDFAPEQEDFAGKSMTLWD
ncbi:hypothetical protein CJ030_MR4G003067 [Morella rubra]|uniref:Uncharacterized protein n=1 Tax=Morella rubra TaxID=262757 RepID=A0A6A1VTT4_9ROSI|nr:hypothetical protein CJ030_MR4G003067 [Morella rubra]